uniref:NADH-ubiquinone oxidoreductase chain 5 n=1 Tax=Brookesia decaryi TaxID=587619 RepID=D6RRX9_BRODE|nr:NADH dehydrogenase subunit 5 [Brookesia decaryi]BAJ08070.1 NADH dehydrogenase subunit 5 [Brookesia decaryi]
MNMTLFNTMTTVTTLLSMLILLVSMFKKNKPNLPLESAVMMSFIISMMPVMIFMKDMIQSTSANFSVLQTSTMDIHMTTTMNMNSNLFLTIALFVTWSIMQFSTWYMKEDTEVKMFKKYLTTFLIAMLILIMSGSMFQLFIGWEGVGIMSFLLINWWYVRTHANSSAMQAMAYNRIGDIGIILILACLSINQTTWEMQLIDPKIKTTLMATGLVLAAAGKSAQFFMHMWLPSAMEGPTPVSALLHSSTMVVAGIYLLIQMHKIISNSKEALTACMYIGAITSFYASMSALTQNDMKKIIALSTLSQLGLMLVAIGLNHPKLALMHISTHAATKAALFLCAGSFIHNLQNEQDIRKMGNMKNMMPITTACLLITNLTLMGMPFLSCFYSKDSIIEVLCTSKINTWTIIMTMMATTATSAYSMRMMFYTTMKTTRNKSMTMLKETANQINPIIRLTTLSIINGTILTTALVTSNIEPTMPTLMKLTPTMTILAGTLLIMEISNKPNYKLNHMNAHYTFFNQLAFFKMTHRWTPKKILSIGAILSTQLTDLLWLEKMGPKHISFINKTTSKLINPLTGLTKTYLSTFVITSMLAMIIQLYY